jgi:aspartate racemase
MNDLAGRIEGLSLEQRRLLELLLEENQRAPQAEKIQRRTTPDFAPLSFAQQRLWILDQLQPDSAAYNIPAAVRLRGAFRIELLQQSLDTIVARHAALRTTFVQGPEQPVQVVAPAQSLILPIIGLEQQAPVEREAEALRLALVESQRPFDLTQGPLIRVMILRLAADEHILVVTMHHIICDGWSIGVFVRELATCYQSFASGQAPGLAELPIQYTDFASWQREWLAPGAPGQVLEEQLAYWKRQLSDLTPVLELPTDRPYPAVQTFKGQLESLALPPTLAAALLEISRQEGATLFMTLLAAFQLLLARYSGQNDIAVGTPIAGRSRPEVEPLIGCFANTLVLRSDLSGDPSFRALLGRVRELCLEAYTHQDVPFEKLVEELHPKRDLSRNPLFQVVFALQNVPKTALQLPGLELSMVDLNIRTAKFDLTLEVEETPHSLVLNLEYNVDLYDAATVARMLQHFKTLLEGIVAQPDQRLSDLDLLSASERHQILVEWNATATPYPRERCIHQLFAAQAARTPDAIALTCGEQALSYHELDGRANQLAQHLRALGVAGYTKGEVRVGLCLHRSLELIVGVLAILKAGGAYVPLDPSYPSARLQFMLDDAQVPIVLTQESLAQHLPEHGARLICLDRDWPQIAQESATPPTDDATADSLAYIMYTSGSTGQPKGVSVIHRNVVRLVQNPNYVRCGPDEVMLQFAPIAFDAATFEIWGSLLNGSRLVLFPPHLPTYQEIGQVIAAQQVTTLWLTAGLFQQMVDNHLDGLRSVRQLLAGGDVLAPAAVQRVLTALPQCTVINGYGPTENTTFTCCYPLTDPDQLGPSVPIGRPISNTEVYVLDDRLNPVPIGVVGELYTSGDGLARGYWRRPELTAERFIPHPFAQGAPAVPGARLYRTGDQVRYRPDGVLTFIGRRDQQVKLRGFRIELSEITAVLAQHPQVGECVVVMREDQPPAGGHPDRRLVAYVVENKEQRTTKQGSAENKEQQTTEQANKQTNEHASDEADANDGSTLCSPHELRDFLKARLPEYMVPAAFVSLPAMPLTAHGKIDRRQLPAPERSAMVADADYVAPRTAVEAVLAALWAEVLGVERVGIHDHFFDLGGHSLLATKLMLRVRDTFKVELALRVLFEAPTVAELAEQVIVHERQPGQSEKIARVWQRIQAMSEAEAAALTSQKRQMKGSL